jgi:hypothetical protein
MNIWNLTPTIGRQIGPIGKTPAHGPLRQLQARPIGQHAQQNARHRYRPNPQSPSGQNSKSQGMLRLVPPIKHRQLQMPNGQQGQRSDRQHGQHPSAAHHKHGIQPPKNQNHTPETSKEPEGSLNVKKQSGSDPNYMTPITLDPMRLTPAQIDTIQSTAQTVLGGDVQVRLYGAVRAKRQYAHH